MHPYWFMYEYSLKRLHEFYSPTAWWLCRRTPLCGRRSQTQNTDGRRKSRKNVGVPTIKAMRRWSVIIQCRFHLVVKGSVGPLLNRSLFLLISDLDDHAGVDVFSHQLSGLRDVNGNLRDGAEARWKYCSPYKRNVSSLHLERFYLEALLFPFTFLDASF